MGLEAWIKYLHIRHIYFTLTLFIFDVYVYVKVSC